MAVNHMLLFHCLKPIPSLLPPPPAPPPPPQAHAKLQVDHEVLGEELKQLQSRSEDIIATLQKERDLAIAECEEQRAQVSVGWRVRAPLLALLHFTSLVCRPDRSRARRLESAFAHSF